MIQYRSSRQSIFDDKAEAYVNPVNCVGKCGRGLALDFKRRFPANHRAYVDTCNDRYLYPGRLLLWRMQGEGLPRWIVNFPTKYHWRNRSSLREIASGLDCLIHFLEDKRIPRVAVPALGCGEGKLPWKDVKKLIQEKLGDLDTEVHLFCPRRGTT